MAELSRKKRVRGGHRSSTTKTVRKAEELLADGSPDLARLAQMKLSLQEKLTILKQLDSEILDLVEEDSVADEIEQSDGFKEDMYAVMVRIEQVSLRSTPPTPGPTILRLASTVRLPKLTMQPFKGELTAWTTFWDSYKAAVDDSPSLSDIDKFNYLRSLLQGPALDAVAGLTLTAANYKEAISVLKRRFGNKQQIVAKHMDTLLNVDAVASDSNLKALRRLYDTIESQVRGLKSLGVASESYGTLLSSVLLTKLPQELRLIVSRKVGDDSWELEKLMELLEDEVRARERAAAGETSSSRKPQKTLAPAPTAATLLTGHGGTAATPTCCYCRQSHSSSSCTAIASVEERKRILQDAGRCFVCSKRGHLSRQCRSSGRCAHCHGRHHSSICTRRESTSMNVGRESGGQQPASMMQPTRMNPAAPPFQPPTTTALWTCSTQAVLLQTARAVVYNRDEPQRSKRVRIVLDSGSQRSYITEKLKMELSLQSNGEQSMSIMTFGSRGEAPQVCDVVNVCMEVRGGQTRQLTLFTVPIICEPLTCQPISFCRDNFKHLSGLPLADPSDGDEQLQVDILIGSDQYWSLLTGNTKRGKCGPVGVETELGWVLSGPVGIPTQEQHQTTLVTHTLRAESLLRQDAQALDDRLKSFWDLESFGIGPDRSVLDEFQDKVCFTEGRYEVSLPWKDPHQLLPDNHQLSLRRLRGLLRQLRQDQEVLTEYDTIIRTQIQQGIVEVVPPEEQAEQVHYLPHHAVIRQDKKTTKLRIVYDASAKSTGSSLNECLHAGPKFDQKILDLLLRFRAHRVAFTADIEKAFLMVSVAKNDRDVLRFLWVDDIAKEQPELVTLRFTRVVFGVSSSPFLLNATIHHHLEKHLSAQPALVERLLRSFYVDDVVTGASDEEQAYTLYRESKEILKKGGFNLRKFCSNSALLQMKVDSEETLDQQAPRVTSTREAEETYVSSTLGPSQEQHTGEGKVLGIRWDIATDQFIMSLEDIASAAAELEPTKRSIVSLVGKFYDPLGLLSPIVIQFKIFLQELCEAKLDWDQSLTGELLEKWRRMSLNLCEGQQTFLTPRCYFIDVQDQDASYDLCGFCDASLKAYAAVVYLRVETSSGHHARLVASKTRVSPLKTQTIPRLELLSALLLARLITSIAQALQGEVKLSRLRCFTDSTVALYWIQGVEKDWKPFVQNRVSEIRRLLPSSPWMHCSGRDNPADLPSRGLTAQELATSQLWKTGPDWLKDGELGGYPDPQMPEECLAEAKSKVTHGLLTSTEPSGVEQLLKCEDFSSLSRLLSVTERVLKFCRILLSKIRPDTVTADSDIRSSAEALWIAASQRVLVKDKKFSHWKDQFELFLDGNRIWQCKGRIQNADVPFSMMHPILLSKDHFLTTLLVRRSHERVMHGGVKATLTELRSQFWIVRGRSVVKQILRQCTVCRRFEGQPYRAPPPPPLPTFRVEEAPPFTHTGVDFAGPLYVRGGDGSSSKVWICLFTCCVTRAVHLDLVPDLSTEAFLRCLKRFAAR